MGKLTERELKDYLEFYILPKIQECYKFEVEKSIKRLFEEED